MPDKPLILVVDDSPTQDVLIRSMLESSYEVVSAANGVLALSSLHERLPDLVVTDLEMPEMNGLELVDAIRAEHTDLPIILTTSQGSEEIASQALSRGASSYVPKRHLCETLLPTVQRMLSMVYAGQHLSTKLSLVTSIRLELRLGNDDSLVADAIARIESSLQELALLDDGNKMQIATALDEALVNAIIHGNLEISSELRHADDGKHYLKEVERRRLSDPYRERQVNVSVSADRCQVVFTIRDDGPGFDYCSLPDPTDVCHLDKCGGRGLLLINAFMDEVHHNATGNEITMLKKKSPAN